MNYDTNTLQWIQKYSAGCGDELEENAWLMVYDALIAHRADKQSVRPGMVYDFLVNEIGEPDVISQSDHPGGSTDYRSSIGGICEHWEDTSNGGFAIQTQYDVIHFLDYMIKWYPNIDRDGLCLWLWVKHLNNGDYFRDPRVSDDFILDSVKYAKEL